MQYKLYRYYLEDDGKPVHPDKHYRIFDRSKGRDPYLEFARYRGRKDAVLMHLRQYRSDFAGLVGKHATERDVTQYDEDEDEILRKRVGDDDYPHAAFICMPRLGLIACVDSGQIKADTAMSRLHAILAHREGLMFVVEAVSEPFDLRKAVRRFRLTEVSFEILPVNPHTGDLGMALDESRKLDHIDKIVGTAHAAQNDPVKLDGGFLTAVQQLQETGHCRVGFNGVTPDGRAEVKVPKPAKAQQLSEDEDKVVAGELIAVRINFRGLRAEYPFNQGHVTDVRTIARRLTEEGDIESNG